jgi:hypothetical protein
VQGCTIKNPLSGIIQNSWFPSSFTRLSSKVTLWDRINFVSVILKRKKERKKKLGNPESLGILHSTVWKPDLQWGYPSPPLSKSLLVLSSTVNRDFKLKKKHSKINV